MKAAYDAEKEAKAAENLKRKEQYRLAKQGEPSILYKIGLIIIFIHIVVPVIVVIFLIVYMARYVSRSIYSMWWINANSAEG